MNVKKPIQGSVILYHGPSMIDGSEIVLIATGADKSSANGKTGAMIQTWILRADINPTTAAATGADEAICGQCPHRLTNGRRTCYVKVFQAPRSIYAAFSAGRYAAATNPAARAAFGAGRVIRIGAYGDPAAVPAHIWAQLLSQSAGRTGYTHQWKHSDPAVRGNARALRRYVMASTDTESEYRDALRAGWRSFRAKPAHAAAAQGERVCPASAEAGHKTSCASCQACSGTDGRGHSSIIINLHGAVAIAAARAA